jgi:hypothetical protein
MLKALRISSEEGCTLMKSIYDGLITYALKPKVLGCILFFLKELAA